MFDPETTAFLESGCALILGTVRPDGEPYAGRAWGLDVVAPGATPRVRILLDADDATTIEHAAAGGAIAITATSVRTLSSVQLKGVSLGIEAPDPEDGARSQRYTHEFFADIMATDGTDRDLLARFEPIGCVACTVEVRELYDQTPGPGAGARVGPPT